MVTNEFERDVNDQAGLKRPGRIDLIILQNTPDAGDGHPGVQRCFRNYLHEGGMEKDLDIHNYKIINLAEPTLASDGARKSNVDAVQTDLDGFQDELKDLTQVEIQQLENIDTTTISGAQWVYVGGADQPVKQADLPTFGGLTVNGNIIITGNVDGVDVSVLKTDFDNHKANNGSDHSFIDQNVKVVSSPTFVGLTLSANLVTTSTVDGVDVSDFKDGYDTYKTAQHNREITPIYITPHDGWTVHDDNVYFLGSSGTPGLHFGSNSYASSHYALVDFNLPSDYVDGEDITIKLNIRIVGVDAKSTYEITCIRFRDGVGLSGYTVDTLSGAWDNASTGNWYDESATITGTELAGNDGLRLRIRLKGTDFPQLIQIQKIVLIITVNTRD